MKKVLLISLVLLVLVAMGCSAAPTPTTPTPTPEMPTITLSVASPYTPTDVTSEAVEIWEKEVTRLTNGKISFENHFGGTLGAPAEHIALVQNGIVDLMLTYPWYTPAKLPLGNFDSIFPFGTTDYSLLLKTKRQIYEEFPQFETDWNNNNATYMWSGGGLVYNIISTKPVTKMADMKGLKMGTIGGYMGRILVVPGPALVSCEAGDMYTLLERRVVEINSDPLNLIASFKQYEVAKYYVPTHHMNHAWWQVAMNLDKFNSLPPEYQQILKETGKWIEDEIGSKIAPQKEANILKVFEDSGVTTCDFPQSERDAWALACPDVPAEWAAEIAKEGYPGWEIVKRWQEIMAEGGFTWPRQWGVEK